MPSIVWIMSGTLLLVLASVSVAAPILSSMISRQEEREGQTADELADCELAQVSNLTVSARELAGEATRPLGGLRDSEVEAHWRREPIQ